MRLLLLALGRRGGSIQLGLRLLAAARQLPNVEARAAISSSSALAAQFLAAASDTLCLPTAARVGPAGLVLNFLPSRRRLLRYIDAEKIEAVFTVMPHVWTPLLAPAIRARGVRYATLIHDAIIHPGDPKAVVTRWLASERHSADLVVTMSQAVAEQLKALPGPPPSRVLPLFHPDYVADVPPAVRRRLPGTPLRLLFFGRILPYKGLPLLIEALEQMGVGGRVVRLGVAGAGDLGALCPRLAALSAEIDNRWFGEDDIAPLFSRYDAVVLSHVEASQSGIPALAYAHGLPVVATPVGGIVEQVVDGETGILAHAATAAALAEAISRLANDAALYDRCATGVLAAAEARSPARFMRAVITALREPG